MTSWLIDASAYSAQQGGHAGIGDAIRAAAELYVTPVVIAELLDGFRHGAQPARNEAFLRKFLAASRTHVLPVDGATAERYVAILQTLRATGALIPTHDLWIAASAMQHGLALLTTDAHFDRVPQILVRRLPRL